LHSGRGLFLGGDDRQSGDKAVYLLAVCTPVCISFQTWAGKPEKGHSHSHTQHLTSAVTLPIMAAAPIFFLAAVLLLLRILKNIFYIL